MDQGKQWRSKILGSVRKTASQHHRTVVARMAMAGRMPPKNGQDKDREPGPGMAQQGMPPGRVWVPGMGAGRQPGGALAGAKPATVYIKESKEISSRMSQGFSHQPLH